MMMSVFTVSPARSSPDCAGRFCDALASAALTDVKNAPGADEPESEVLLGYSAAWMAGRRLLTASQAIDAAQRASQGRSARLSVCQPSVSRKAPAPSEARRPMA